jgi:hypothetical protein
VKHVLAWPLPGEDGAAFGLQVLDQLEALKWHEEATCASLPESNAFVADCALCGVRIKLPRGKATAKGGEKRGKKKVLVATPSQISPFR